MASFYSLEPGTHKSGEGFFPMQHLDIIHVGAVGTRFTWTPGVFKDGIRRKENFLWSDFVAFDVDNMGEEIYSLEQAKKDWCDSIVVIGTSRSHQVSKRGQPPRDRFRIITKWEYRITDAATYEASYRAVLDRFPAFDRACADAAHCFFPHKIAFFNSEGFCESVIAAEKEPHAHIGRSIREYMKERSFKIPNHVNDFIKRGIIFGDGRNQSVYVSTLELLNFGMDPEKVLELLCDSPFDRQEFSNAELTRTYLSACRRYLSQK